MFIMSTVFAKSSCICMFGYSTGMPLIVSRPPCKFAWLAWYVNSRPVGFFYKVIHQCIPLVPSVKCDGISGCGVSLKTLYIDVLHVGFTFQYMEDFS